MLRDRLDRECGIAELGHRALATFERHAIERRRVRFGERGARRGLELDQPRHRFVHGKAQSIGAVQCTHVTVERRRDLREPRAHDRRTRGRVDVRTRDPLDRLSCDGTNFAEADRREPLLDRHRAPRRDR